MLLTNEVRRRGTFIPVGLLVMGLGLALATIGVALLPEQDPRELAGLAAFALFVLGWFAFGWRHAAREGGEIVVRSLSGSPRVPAKGCEVTVQQGGGHRSPHLDVLLQPAQGPALRLARHEMFGLSGAPRTARRLAALLDVPVDERGVGGLEARIGATTSESPTRWRGLAILVAVGLVASVVMSIVVGQTMATVVIRCPGGQVREGTATMLDGLEMTADPGPHAYELHPASGPPWTQRVELVEGETTVLDCRARPRPASP